MYKRQPQGLRSVSISLERVGDVERSEGEREAALKRYRESLDICHRIVEQFGESPQSLRDVSISLERVGDVERSEGEREAALKRYRESLDLRRRIVEQFGESPQSLADVVASCFKMSQVDPLNAVKHLTEAKRISDFMAERNWLTADQSQWPTILKQLLDSLDGEE